MHQPLKIALISALLVEGLLDEATQKFPKETGGILMGYRFNLVEFFITDMIGPGPKARHTRWAFEPDYEFQRERVASLYEASGRSHSYLGDWHTHPGGTSHLSALDLAALRNISASEEARCCSPLMLLIVGGPNWRLHLWQWSPGSPGSRRPVELQVT
jgi:integrative and conjugative element protein (TIGR02256 family)